MADLEGKIVSHLDSFIGFARKRLNDPELAADVVQDSLVKALQAAEQPKDEEKMVPWFYQILRRTIIDTYRRKASRSRALEDFEEVMKITPDEEGKTIICDCFRALLPQMPPQYQEILRSIDLDGQSTKETAKNLGITENNLNVRLFRARKQLRKHLEDVCMSCSVLGCLDCTCEEPSP